MAVALLTMANWVNLVEPYQARLREVAEGIGRKLLQSSGRGG